MSAGAWKPMRLSFFHRPGALPDAALIRHRGSEQADIANGIPHLLPSMPWIVG